MIFLSVSNSLFALYFVIQPFFVLGASMEPSFENGDYLVIDEISYKFKEPEKLISPANLDSICSLILDIIIKSILPRLS